MLKTKQHSPRSETKFAPEIKFGAKKKRHLPSYKFWDIVESVARRHPLGKGAVKGRHGAVGSPEGYHGQEIGSTATRDTDRSICDSGPKPDHVVVSQQGIVDLLVKKTMGRRPRIIRNLSEALTMTAKSLYLRANAAKTDAERQTFLEWARARVRLEFQLGIRKPLSKKSAAA